MKGLEEVGALQTKFDIHGTCVSGAERRTLSHINQETSNPQETCHEHD